MKKILVLMAALVLNVGLANAQRISGESRGRKTQSTEQVQERKDTKDMAQPKDTQMRKGDRKYTKNGMIMSGNKADRLAKEMHLNRQDSDRFTKIYREYQQERREAREHFSKNSTDRKYQLAKIDVKYRRKFAKILNEHQLALVMDHQHMHQQHKGNAVRHEIHGRRTA